MINALLLPEYIINHQTMMLLAQKDESDRIFSWVIEEQSEYLVEKNPTEVIKETCEYLGSDFNGRQEGTKVISGYSHKPPISIDPHVGIYFFPTISPSISKCDWVSHSHVSTLSENRAQNKTDITFVNKRKISVDISYRTIETQMLRTAQFRHILSQRITDFKNG